MIEADKPLMRINVEVNTLDGWESHEYNFTLGNSTAEQRMAIIAQLRMIFALAGWVPL